MMNVVFDIDGTLADCSHRIHYLEESPKNWDAFFSENEMVRDRLIHPAAEILRLLRKDFKIVFVTGRPEKTRKVTEYWLRCFSLLLPDDLLLMRADGDCRNDDILKPEILADLVGIETIACMFEDRARIVKAVRALGVTVYQVAEGNY